MSDYQDYLKKIHAGMETPEDILRTAVFEATGVGVKGKHRVVAGEANEVYDVALSNNAHVFVRISREEKPEFEQERWAIRQCRKVGVPVPDVLLIKHLEYEARPLHICVQKKVAGESLDRGGVDMHALPKKELKSIIGQAGEVLSRIHSIKTNGFGEIDGEGRAARKTFQELMSEHIGQGDIYMPIAQEAGFDVEKMRQAFAILEKENSSLPDIQSVLNHGDFGPKHIMVENGRVSGLLDFGEVQGNSPVHDLSRWDYWYGDEIPFEWLKAGYADKSIFEADFDKLYHLTRIHSGLGALWYYHGQKYAKGIDGVLKRLLPDLEFYF